MIDSLSSGKRKIDKLVARAVSVLENSPEISLELLIRALNSAAETEYKEAEAAAHYQLGRVYTALGNYPDSVKHLKAALPIYETLDDKESQMNTLSLLGMNLAYLGNSSDALKNTFAALEISEKNGYDTFTAKLLNNLGNLYYSKDDFESAKTYYLRSIPLKEKLNDIKGLGAAYTNLATTELMLKNVDIAFDYVLQSIEIKKKYTDTVKDEASLAFAKNILGSIKRLQKNYSDALKIYSEVLDIYLRQSNMLMLCETYALIAATYIDMGDKKSALKAINAAEEFTAKINAVRITEEFIRLKNLASE